MGCVTIFLNVVARAEVVLSDGIVLGHFVAARFNITIYKMHAVIFNRSQN
jgi:hypothetical protein